MNKIGKFILKNLWVFWLNAWLVEFGITFFMWQWWVFTLGLSVLLIVKDEAQGRKL